MINVPFDLRWVNFYLKREMKSSKCFAGAAVHIVPMWKEVFKYEYVQKWGKEKKIIIRIKWIITRTQQINVTY
jgi:hypothetical protein